MSDLHLLPNGKNPSLDQKIGQMLLVGFRGTTIEEGNSVIADIKDSHVGGVIYFDQDMIIRDLPYRNIQSPEQVKNLSARLQQLSEIPLFISIDQEGGKVNRLKPELGFPATKSHTTLGNENNETETYNHSRLIAKTLKDVGINLNFAPCLDLGVNPLNTVIYKKERHFSADPVIVGNHGSAYIMGHVKEGVLATVKHFPGHGSSMADTHLSMADVTDTWSYKELEPYKKIIAEGTCSVVMVSHVFNKKLDPDWPSTLSQNVINGMLRRDLGFDGVAISDDMQMQAIHAHYGLETAIMQGLKAGMDIFCFGNNTVYEPESTPKIFNIIRNAVKEGIISEDRINASYNRIMKVKKLVGII